MSNVVRLPDGRPASPAFLAGLREVAAAEGRRYAEGNRVEVQPDGHPGTVVAVRASALPAPLYRVCFDGTGALCWLPAFMLAPILGPVVCGKAGAQ